MCGTSSHFTGIDYASGKKAWDSPLDTLIRKAILTSKSSSAVLCISYAIQTEERCAITDFVATEDSPGEEEKRRIAGKVTAPCQEKALTYLAGADPLGRVRNKKKSIYLAHRVDSDKMVVMQNGRIGYMVTSEKECRRYIKAALRNRAEVTRSLGSSHHNKVSLDTEEIASAGSEEEESSQTRNTTLVLQLYSFSEGVAKSVPTFTMLDLHVSRQSDLLDRIASHLVHGCGANLGNGAHWPRDKLLQELLVRGVINSHDFALYCQLDFSKKGFTDMFSLCGQLMRTEILLEEKYFGEASPYGNLSLTAVKPIRIETKARQQICSVPIRSISTEHGTPLRLGTNSTSIALPYIKVPAKQRSNTELREKVRSRAQMQRWNSEMRRNPILKNYAGKTLVLTTQKKAKKPHRSNGGAGMATRDSKNREGPSPRSELGCEKRMLVNESSTISVKISPKAHEPLIAKLINNSIRSRPHPRDNTMPRPEQSSYTADRELEAPPVCSKKQHHALIEKLRLLAKARAGAPALDSTGTGKRSPMECLMMNTKYRIASIYGLKPARTEEFSTCKLYLKSKRTFDEGSLAKL